jgi:hypothetical protein
MEPDPMTDTPPPWCTAFDGHRRLASGPLPDVALAVKHAIERGAGGPVLTYDDATGRVIDLDTRGSDAELLARLAPPAPAEPDEAPRGRGRPRLGVVAREVTLLPRHWQWLSAQPGGASVTLRRLVEEARRANADRDRRREAREAAYRFMAAMAGDLPGFEEAARALFADAPARFDECVARWPADVREHAARLAFGNASPPALAPGG